MKKGKEIFDKQEWISKLKELMTSHVKGLDVIEAFGYVGDIIEDLIEMACDQHEKIEILEGLLKEHKHLNGKVVKEL